MFSSSYRLLDRPTARLFRLLGLHPGNTIDAAVASAIAGISQDEASLLLHNLATMHLIRNHDDRHYQLLELLRCYASELAKQLETEAERDQAMKRLADWHLR